jgi:hypothetical protein
MQNFIVCVILNQKYFKQFLFFSLLSHFIWKEKILHKKCSFIYYHRMNDTHLSFKNNIGGFKTS